MTRIQQPTVSAQTQLKKLPDEPAVKQATTEERTSVDHRWKRDTGRRVDHPRAGLEDIHWEVRVEFAGIRFSEQNELNGIAFQGVGAATQCSNIEVLNNQDDGVEFFGGTVNCENVFLYNNEDDSVDWTRGWQGSLQYVRVKHIQDDQVDWERCRELGDLWRSDGTPAGTVLVKDIYPGVYSASPNWLTVVDGVLYFMVTDGVHGNELWRSDAYDSPESLAASISWISTFFSLNISA